MEPRLSPIRHLTMQTTASVMARRSFRHPLVSDRRSATYGRRGRDGSTDGGKFDSCAQTDNRSYVDSYEDLARKRAFFVSPHDSEISFEVSRRRSLEAAVNASLEGVMCERRWCKFGKDTLEDLLYILYRNAVSL